MGCKASRLDVIRRAPYLARWIRQAGKAVKRRRVGIPLSEKEAEQLVECLVPEAQSLKAAELQVVAHPIQCLASRMGGVFEVSCSHLPVNTNPFIAKVIRTPPQAVGPEVQRDYNSYLVEACFYENGHAAAICAAGAPCPQALRVDRHVDGALTVCLTKLPGKECGCNALSESQVRAVLSWLARLHACYWGSSRADVAVASGLQQQGCFWNLDIRAKELTKMPSNGLEGRLRLAAVGLDERLKADEMQTICHGDAKDANIFIDDRGDVALLDFQWCGKAAASKDVAYCIMCAAGRLPVETEIAHLHHYHRELSRLLEAQHDSAPSWKCLESSYVLAVCDLARWMSGWAWWGNVDLMFRHLQAVLHKLDQGVQLKSEEDYREAVFRSFPLAGPCACIVTSASS